MASLNDFKLVNVKSKKYYDLLSKSIHVSTELGDTDKTRFGFYLLMLENICGIKDISNILELITDQDFNRIIYKKSFDDHGIDAIQIDDENFEIKLFNFKFRETYNKNKMQSINEVILSTKFINALITENTDKLQDKIKLYADEIIKRLNSNDIWKLSLYVISNENIELSKKDINLKQLEDLYELEIVPIGLNNIRDMMSIRPEPINAILMLDKDAIMSFAESSISSSKSYIIRIPLTEVIRITCNDHALRENYSIEDLTPLSNTSLDFSVLFDNVRGFVLKSKYNDNIEKSLKDNPTKFFMYNNGITITANDIQAVDVNAAKKIKLSIMNFQVLNGGQTLRTIHNFNKSHNDEISKNLSNSEILVRIFKTTTDSNLINKIAEYTNSQNAISNIDLKSLSSEQIELEQLLDTENIIYARKTGDTGLSATKEYDYKISMERFGQILFAIKGYPEKSSNQKKDIFDKYYDFLFSTENLEISDAPKQIRRYFQIRHIYENNTKGYSFSEQKIFYIIYIDNNVSMDILDQIDKFEHSLSEYTPESKTSIADSRKLLQLKFKDFLNKQFGIIQ